MILLSQRKQWHESNEFNEDNNKKSKELIYFRMKKNAMGEFNVNE